MKKVVLVLAMVALTFSMNAQEIVKTEKPIYNSAGLVIKNVEDNVLLLFRNAKYKYIIDFKAIRFESKSDVSLLFSKMTELLEAPTTSKDEDLTITFKGFEIIRHGFAQEVIYLQKDSGGYIRLTKSVINKVSKELNNK